MDALIKAGMKKIEQAWPTLFDQRLSLNVLLCWVELSNECALIKGLNLSGFTEIGSNSL